MGILTKILTVFNSLSPVEAYPYDEPTEELRAIDIHTDSELEKLADKTTLAEVQQALVFQIVDLVHKVAISSATANIAHKHTREFRLLNENPKDEALLTLVQGYFKEIPNTPKSLDDVTYKLLDQIQHFYPSLRDCFNDYAIACGAIPMKRYEKSPIENSRLLDKQTVMNPTKGKTRSN